MARDIAALKAKFAASDDAGKIELFREVVTETIDEFQNGSLMEATATAIKELLEIFKSMDEESAEMIEIAENARDNLLALQYSDDATYTAQMEPINELLDFLREYQPPEYEDIFALDQDVEATTVVTGGSAAVAAATYAVPDPDQNSTEVYHGNGYQNTFAAM